MPKSIREKLESWGSVGSLIVTIFTTQWSVGVTAIISTVVTLWGSTNSFAQSPYVLTWCVLFIFLLWTWIGCTVLYDRRYPRVITPYQDYRYALTFEGLIPIVSKPLSDDDPSLRFGVNLRNYGSGPIKYNIAVFDVTIDDRIIPPMKPNSLFSVMPRGSARTSKAEAMSYGKVKEFFGKRVVGKAKFDIHYGHPEGDPVRSLKMEFDLILHLHTDDPNASFFDANITAESDTAIDRNNL